MMSSYLAQSTPLHRMPAELKLAALALISLVLLPVEDWRILVAALAATVCVYLALGPQARVRLGLLRPLVPVLLLIGLFQVFALDWQSAVAALARLVVMILLAELVTMTTPMQAMMDALMPVMRPLRFVGLQPRILTLAVTLVIRFVPMLLELWQRRVEAWRARGGKRTSLRLVAPFMGDALRLADHTAEALAARGYSMQHKADSFRTKQNP